MKRLGAAIAATLLMVGTVAQAFEFEWGPVRGSSKNSLSVGAAIRMQDPSSDLIGKLNIPGQSGLCGGDSCISLSGDPEPNQRLIDAPGAFSAVNQDNGNLNYDKHDLVAGTTKLVTDWSLTWGEWAGRFRAIGYYDPVNVNFDERHNDTRAQPARTPRSKDVEGVYARGVELFEAFVSRQFEIGDRFGAISIGNQYIRWGESTLVAINSINEISPPSQAFLRFPGVEFNEIFLPVPLVVVSTDVAAGVTAEAFYQLQWKAVQPDPAGSFYSDFDLINGTSAVVSLGQFGEDPDQRLSPEGVIGTVSSTATSVNLRPEEAPSDSGQYGIKLNYYADWLNNGTELNLYAMNYHSRLPLVVTYATEASCTRIEGNGSRDSANAVQALLDCGGFNGTLIPGRDPSPDREPLPIDTLGLALAYPEDIRLFGFSFNTNVGKWSLAGEYVYRPNLPLQVQLTDVIFAGLQPAFPANQLAAPPLVGDLPGLLDAVGLDIVDLDPTGLVGLLSATFPSSQEGIPSFLQAYRGIDRVAPGQRIEGWERMKVHQLGFTGIRALSSNPFGADQLLVIAEVGATYVQGMPSRDELQFETSVMYRTHASPGADCSGSPGTPVEDCTRRLNPTQQTEGFADDFSWGLRTIIRGEYNNVVFGWNFRPQLIAGWDVDGIAPFPSQNFVEGRKQFELSTDILFTQALSMRLGYNWFTGGGRDNNRRDRDNALVNVVFNF